MVVLAAMLRMDTASAATVPSPPPSCSAHVVDATTVQLSWWATTNDGGSPLKWYAYQRQGDTGTFHTFDGSTLVVNWTGTYTTADNFRVRAVNAVGFSTWTNCAWVPGTPTRPLLPYSSTSWLRTSISGLGLTQDATKTSSMRSYINTHDPHSNPNLQGLNGGTGTGWGTSWGGVATCSDPTYKIGTGTVNAKNSFLTTTGFHASATLVTDLNNAKNNGGTDLPFEVIDTCGNSTFPNGFVVKGTQATVVAGTSNPTVINVGGYAGAYDQTSNGLRWDVPTSDGTNNWSSRGVIPASASIRHDQLKYAVDNTSDLGQRLEIFWWETDSSAGMISPPMAGFENNQFGWGAEGQVIGIDPTFVPSGTCPEGAKAIIRNGQTYGFYIGDNAGAGGTSLKMDQDHGQYTDIPGMTQRAFDSCGLTWNNFVAY